MKDSEIYSKSANFFLILSFIWLAPHAGEWLAIGIGLLFLTVGCVLLVLGALKK